MTVLAMVLAILCVLFAAWLRAAGTAITRIARADALRDASDDIRGAEGVAELLESREAISPAIGVLASAFLVVGSVVATAVLARALPVAGAVGVALGVGIVAFLAGDLIPRRLGRLEPGRLAYRSHRVLAGAVRIGGWANDLIPETDNGVEEVGETAEEEAEEQERELIDSVLEFGETIVREVMTPRPDMVTIDQSDSIDELIRVATDEGYSRLPVTANGDVVGMVIVKDLLRMLTDEKRPMLVSEVMRPVEFVPETKLAAALLAEMQESRTHQVIVVDEYGDVAGLVTIEDLLEELVGEITDETDSEQAMIMPLGSGWWVDGRLPVHELIKVTGVEVSEVDGDTVGGLVLDLAERVPEEGEVFEFEQLELTVTRMQGRRVAEVTVAVTERTEPR
ncbi:MAG TPA: hemolysin family protein [Acidimicrobiia bacterium]|jgi:CBS domain containing-hemolysin-like protein|nr:hemolysin family protein [Acidimicrobiia bacterium]